MKEVFASAVWDFVFHGESLYSYPMPNQTTQPEPYDDRNLVAALVLLAQSNFDLIAAKTGMTKTDARKAHQDTYNALFGNR